MFLILGTLIFFMQYSCVFQSGAFFFLGGEHFAESTGGILYIMPVLMKDKENQLGATRSWLRKQK